MRPLGRVSYAAEQTADFIAFTRSPEGIISSDQRSPANSVQFFALIIGINVYRSLQIPPLRGAVPDANAVQHFLESILGVPTANIRNLRDKEATREAIIHALQALAEDGRIHHGDAILIYFAGHGSSIVAPAGWQGPRIETLIPYDYDSSEDSGVHSIPDRTISVLLNSLADQKGDNITVVLDCCHSGSGTRTGNTASSYIIRGIDSSEVVPPDIDRKVLNDAPGLRAIQSPGFAHAGLRSHVLIAACGAGENAQEQRGRGVFTRAFLQTLLAMGSDRITYRELIRRIPELHGQNPQCEGFNQDRILFNERAIVRNMGRVFLQVRKVDEDYIMDGGNIHGITIGSKFALYEDIDCSSLLGYLVVTTTDAYSTTLDLAPDSPPFALDHTGYALQVRASAEEGLHVHIGAGEELAMTFRKVMQELQNHEAVHQKILLVAREQAELDVALEHGRIVFNILDGLVTKFGLTRLPFDITPDVDNICRVLNAAARYFWHLRRSSQSNILRQKIGIEFTKLVQLDEFDDFLLPILRPDLPSLIRDGIVDFHADDSSMYGIKITNYTNLALFPSLFYFDNSDLSIQSSYLPPTSGGNVDPPLPPGGSLTIGYGSGGAAPFSYFLRDGQSVDVGFLKLFLSTEPVHLSHLVQQSPFDFEAARSNVIHEEESGQPTWETVLITVVQRRSGPVSIPNA